MNEWDLLLGLSVAASEKVERGCILCPFRGRRGFERVFAVEVGLCVLHCLHQDACVSGERYQSIQTRNYANVTNARAGYFCHVNHPATACRRRA